MYERTGLIALSACQGPPAGARIRQCGDVLCCCCCCAVAVLLLVRWARREDRVSRSGRGGEYLESKTSPLKPSNWSETWSCDGREKRFHMAWRWIDGLIHYLLRTHLRLGFGAATPTRLSGSPLAQLTRQLERKKNLPGYCT